MRKTFFLLFSIILTLLVQSQTILVSGDTIIANLDPCFETSTTLKITNNTLDSLDIHCEKIIVDTTLGTENFFCWGAECYGSNVYISTSFNSLAPGESDNIDFGGYYNAFCKPATATIEYCFFPLSNTNDKTCITVLYNESLTSTEFGNKNEFILSQNPNEGFYEFRTVSNDFKKIKVFNIIGEMVFNDNLSQKKYLKIDFLFQKRSMYIVEIIDKKNQIFTEKIFVN